MVRLAPFTGIVFVALVAAAIATGGSTPNSDAGGLRVILYYVNHQSSQRASNLLFLLAAVFFVFFVGSLYGLLREALAAQTLAAVGFGGGLLFALGLTLFAGVGFALADVPSRLTPAAAQALNVLDNDLFFPFAMGSVVFGVGTGLAIARSGLLPGWLGWVLLVLGIVSVPLFPLFLLMLIWVVLVSVLMYRRSGRPSATGPVISTV